MKAIEIETTIKNALSCPGSALSERDIQEMSKTNNRLTTKVPPNGLTDMANDSAPPRMAPCMSIKRKGKRFIRSR